MNTEANQPTKHLEHHKGGTLRARGQTVNGLAHGYWEWFRTDGTRMRSGHFDMGVQVGRWTTYDRAGEAYKVTEMKPDASKALTRL